MGSAKHGNPTCNGKPASEPMARIVNLLVFIIDEECTSYMPAKGEKRCSVSAHLLISRGPLETARTKMSKGGGGRRGKTMYSVKNLRSLLPRCLCSPGEPWGSS